MATVNAASATQSDVQDAIDAALSGDTVIVPAGTETWATGVIMTLAIKLQGNGIGSTVITSSIGGAYSYLVSYNPVAAEINKTFEMTGFTFDGDMSSGIFHIGAPSTSPVTGFKVHDNKFQNASMRAIDLTGLEFGLFWDNEFLNNNVTIFAGGSETNGWNIAIGLGGVNYPYFEDNTFTQTVARGGFVAETGRGGRICFRHNTIVDYGGGGGEVWDAHGVNTIYPADRGTVCAEYYENDVDLSANTRVFNHRGGVAIVFNNAITGGFNGYMTMTEYQGWSYCTVQTYPKYDQVNNSYYYGNTLNGAPATSDIAGNTGCTPTQQDSDFIQLDRDFFRTDPVGETILGAVYTPYTYPHPLQGESAAPYVRIY